MSILTGTILSIAFFNFAGVTVTKEISATTRMVLDSVRTLFIYIVSLALRWQTFYWLQVIFCFFFGVVIWLDPTYIGDCPYIAYIYLILCFPFFNSRTMYYCFRLLDLFSWWMVWHCTTMFLLLSARSWHSGGTGMWDTEILKPWSVSLLMIRNL